MAKQQPAKPDPQALEDAQHTWAGFTKLLKWSVISTVVILAILGLVFIVL